MTLFKPSLIAATLFCATSAIASTTTPLNREVYSMARDDIQALYKAERDACKSLSGNAKDICVETAKGREKVALAHLEFQRSGKPADRASLAKAQLEARYEIAKERCDDLSGNAKDACQVQARSERDKAMADMKAAKEIAEIRSEQQVSKDRADFAMAQEKCNSLSGARKDSCEAAARARYMQ
jgi:hypothetical protein